MAHIIHKAKVAKPGGYIAGLDAIRGFAALAVVLFHITRTAFQNQFGVEPVGDAFAFGYCGLDVFFVLSGFIIFYNHAEDLGHPRRLPDYGWKRLVRIYPAYWLVTALFLALAIVSHAPPPFARVWHSFTLVPGADFLLTVAWTLPHELLFYAVFALAFLSSRMGLIVGAGFLIASAFLWASPNPILNFLFNIRHFEFGVGLGIAVLIRSGARRASKLVLAAGLAAFVGAALINVLRKDASETVLIGVYGISSGAMLYGLVALEKSGFNWVPRWLSRFGEASYALYLVHTLAFSLIARLFKAIHLDRILPGYALLTLVLIMIIAAGMGFHRLVEKPLLQLCRQISPFRLSGRRGAPTAGFWFIGDKRKHANGDCDDGRPQEREGRARPEPLADGGG